MIEAIKSALESRGLRISTLVEPERGGMRRVVRLWQHDDRLARAELYTATRFMHLYVQLDGIHEDQLVIGAAVPGLALWLGFNPSYAALRDWLRSLGSDRETGFHVYLPSPDNLDLRVHWRVHSPVGSWSKATPGWRDGSLNVHDLLLGRIDYSSKVLQEQEVLVPLPERSYRWKVQIVEVRHKRPRWPWDRVTVCAHCDALEGEQIPVPGKGENSYDLDDDALHGMGCPASSVSEAVGAIVRNVTGTRLKRGWNR